MTPATTSAGRLIEDFLVRKGMTRKLLAKKLGLSPAYLTMLMKGERPFNPHIAGVLSKKTDIPADRLLQDRTMRGSTGPTTGTVLADWRITKAQREGLLTIDPFRGEGDESRVQAASYDLSRGDFTFPGKKWDESKRTLVLAPGKSALVRTREEITLSRKVIGRIAPQGDLVLHFVILGFGLHLDPGWVGSPFMLVHNHGEDDFVLDYDQPFASVEFHLLADDPESPWEPEKGSALN